MTAAKYTRYAHGYNRINSAHHRCEETPAAIDQRSTATLTQFRGAHAGRHGPMPGQMPFCHDAVMPGQMPGQMPMSSMPGQINQQSELRHAMRRR